MKREENQLSATVPSDATLTLQVESEVEVEELRSRMCACIRDISTWVDLATLDGVTVSSDYRKALRDLDRGVDVLERDNCLRPTSDGYAVGVAMAPTLLRDGRVKSHLFFEYVRIRGICSDKNSGEFLDAFHALCHECGHVEAVGRFDSAFPGVLLRPPPESWHALDEAKWKYAIEECWQEYIVCRRTAEFGRHPLDAYVEVFLSILRHVDNEGDRMVRECREDGEYGKVFHGLFTLYGKLMKHSCYVLGTMHGLALGREDVPILNSELTDSWFRTYFNRLGQAGHVLYESYGTWKDYQTFTPFGDILEELVARKGVTATPQRGRSLYVTLGGTL